MQQLLQGKLQHSAAGSSLPNGSMHLPLMEQWPTCCTELHFYVVVVLDFVAVVLDFVAVVL